jgi:hypothetical protein
MNASQQLPPFSRSIWMDNITAHGVRHFVEACDKRWGAIAQQADSQNQAGDTQS